MSNHTSTDCRTPDGTTVGLIDTIITAARVLAQRDLSPGAVQEALADLRSDSDVQSLLARVGTPCLVGDDGPELIVPVQSGTIVPNGPITITLNISVDARGVTDPRVLEEAVHRAAKRLVQ